MGQFPCWVAASTHYNGCGRHRYGSRDSALPGARAAAGHDRIVENLFFPVGNSFGGIMHKLKIVGAVLLLVFGCVPVFAQTGLPPEVAKQGYADVIAINGKIVSMDDGGLNQNPGNIYQAMAIKNNRLVALGTTERIRTFADADTVVIDLAGQTVIPGIVESHVHIFGDPQLAAQMGLRSPDKGVNVTVEAGKD